MKDNHRAISCINQAYNANIATEKNAEIIRNDIELMIIDALHYGEFTSADEATLKRIRTSLANAINLKPLDKADMVNNIKERLVVFL